MYNRVFDEKMNPYLIFVVRHNHLYADVGVKTNEKLVSGSDPRYVTDETEGPGTKGGDNIPHLLGQERWSAPMTPFVYRTTCSSTQSPSSETYSNFRVPPTVVPVGTTEEGASTQG